MNEIAAGEPQRGRILAKNGAICLLTAGLEPSAVRFY
jgi:hypothetical protein